MPDTLRSRRLLPFAAPLLGLAAWAAREHWRGPELAGCRLEARPLVQRVVASGTVGSQSLARVGSEKTGVIAARHVQEGDRVALGDLLDLIGRLDTPSAGELYLHYRAGRPTTSTTARTRLRNEAIGFVFQFHHLIPAFNVLDNG